VYVGSRVGVEGVSEFMRFSEWWWLLLGRAVCLSGGRVKGVGGGGEDGGGERERDRWRRGKV
jgi:hypothetical protein